MAEIYPILLRISHVKLKDFTKSKEGWNLQISAKGFQNSCWILHDWKRQSTTLRQPCSWLRVYSWVWVWIIDVNDYSYSWVLWWDITHIHGALSTALFRVYSKSWVKMSKRLRRGELCRAGPANERPACAPVRGGHSSLAQQIGVASWCRAGHICHMG